MNKMDPAIDTGYLLQLGTEPSEAYLSFLQPKLDVYMKHNPTNWDQPIHLLSWIWQVS